MPTNIMRRYAPDGGQVAHPRHRQVERRAKLQAGPATVELALLNTTTAELLWHALPIFSVAETWGASLHFACPVRAGRERTARLNVEPGDVCYWSEDDRVMLGWGPTPISRPNEIRLMRPCNVWARALGDASVLGVVTPGEKVTLARL